VPTTVNIATTSCQLTVAYREQAVDNLLLKAVLVYRSRAAIERGLIFQGRAKKPRRMAGLYTV